MASNLLIASKNPGKVQEIAQLLEEIGVRLLLPGDLGLMLEVSEMGKTYRENARKKAAAYARFSGLVTLGDDSGLEVDALGGAPGLHTARFAGPGASDAERYGLLLRKLEGIPASRRSARFHCAVAIARPDGKVVAITAGICEGTIAFEPAGVNGFGYDPVFFLPEYGCTMAELPANVKNRISHRARAVKAARPQIMLALQRSSSGQ